MNDLKTFEALAKAVSDGGRVRILKMLQGGELCVCQITAVLGLSTPTVSAHLAVLRRAGLITSRRDGRWVYYALTPTASGPNADMLALLDRTVADDVDIINDRARLATVTAQSLDALCAQPVKTRRSA